MTCSLAWLDAITRKTAGMTKEGESVTVDIDQSIPTTGAACIWSLSSLHSFIEQAAETEQSEISVIQLILIVIQYKSRN